MTVWRKLMKSGAVSLKGTVYILPFTTEHYEFIQWLVTEVKGMSGDAAIVSIDKVDTITDAEIIELFDQARMNDYLPIEQELEEITRKLSSIKKGGQGHNLKGLAGKFDKIVKAFSEVQRGDFFSSAKGQVLGRSIDRIQGEWNQLLPAQSKGSPELVVERKSVADYQRRVWATRKRPFVDRMASAWLIKHAIDPEAVFEFIDEDGIDALPEETIVFDMYGGEFTHVGDLCTFEVLIRAFSLKDKVLWQLAETVHNLDMKDDKYQADEAVGIERVLTGIRKTATDDRTALAQGMDLFAMLYASKH